MDQMADRVVAKIGRIDSRREAGRVGQHGRARIIERLPLLADSGAPRHRNGCGRWPAGVARPREGECLERYDAGRLPLGEPFFRVGPEPLDAGLIIRQSQTCCRAQKRLANRSGSSGSSATAFSRATQSGRPISLQDEKVAEPAQHLGSVGLESNGSFVAGQGVVVSPAQLEDMTEV